ncbi:MAG: hypothetical protein KC619_19505 [Myxococcales bacterium]|nr:hypothetical protein [Myxococcales bacterium]
MPPRGSAPAPTRRQYRLSRLITRWYLDRYYGTDQDVGVAAMFCDPSRVGHFAVDRDALAAGDGDALFRVLVATVMFQRRQDAQILRVLRGISEADARELTSARRLLALADKSPCDHLRSNEALIGECDLGKDPETKLGTCGRHPELACHLKQHTVLLKRYGHFGKVPTSAALNLRDHGAEELPALRTAVLRDVGDPTERAVELERRLSSAWRVSEKIAAMFLSAVANPDLSPGLAPWSEGIDWARYVVVDSNVDLFLAATGYPGPWTYAARAGFMRRLASRVDLIAEGLPDGHPINPRLVQQAIYLFMSTSNRRASPQDCAQRAPVSCATCPSSLRSICPR